MSKSSHLSILAGSLLALALHLSTGASSQAQTAPASKKPSVSAKQEPASKEELKETLGDLKTQAKAIGEAFVEKKDLEPLKKVELHSKTREAKALELLVNHFITMQNQYQADLKALDWESYLSPERIQGDEGQVQSKKMIAGARQAFDRYERTLMNRQPLYDMAKQWSNSPAEQNSFKKGIDIGLDRKMPVFQKQLAIEKTLMEKIEELATILGENKKHWKYVNQQILFSDDALLTKFNAEYANLNKLIADQEILHRQSMQEGLRNMDKVKNNL